MLRLALPISTAAGRESDGTFEKSTRAHRRDRMSLLKLRRRALMPDKGWPGRAYIPRWHMAACLQGESPSDPF
jgi:hypothetical protein